MRFSTSSSLSASSVISGLDAVSERSLRSLGMVLGVSCPSGVKLIVLFLSGWFRRSPASTSSSRRVRCRVSLVVRDVLFKSPEYTMKFRPPHVGHQNDNPNSRCARSKEPRSPLGSVRPLYHRSPTLAAAVRRNPNRPPVYCDRLTSAF
jgi:hypothetical protein